MTRGFWGWGLLVGLSALGCGGSTPEGESPDDADLEAVDPDWDTGAGRGASADPDAETERNLAKAEEKPKPEFTDGMSVEQAIAAVPRHYDFVGIDQETLAKPLQDPETFKECNVGAQHFKMRVAVWDGKAVGIDVETKNEALKECLTAKAKGIEWKEKEESINTVEYSL